MSGFDAVAFGRRVREQRQAKDFTVEELAGWAGYSPSYWSEIERGNVPNLSIQRLFEIANLLGVSPTALIAMGGK